MNQPLTQRHRYIKEKVTKISKRLFSKSDILSFTIHGMDMHA